MDGTGVGDDGVGSHGAGRTGIGTDGVEPPTLTELGIGDMEIENTFEVR